MSNINPLVLKNISGLLRKKKKPIQILRYYIKIISKRQQARYLYLKPVNDIIEKHIRSISINETDAEKIKIRNEKVDMLIGIKKEMHERYYSDDALFIESLKRILKFT
jgi:hypothetical protein